MLTIQSRSHPYTVEPCPDLAAALEAISTPERAFYLVDRNLVRLYPAELERGLPGDRTVVVDATEEQKSYEAIAPVFLDLVRMGLKRDGNLVVVGGGILQDIGCFVATTLSRGLHWELIPTTLLAQADSCIGSKSSINLGPYKNQLGTFYPPHRVLMTHAVLRTLPWDPIRSGVGEILKLALLAGPEVFQELSKDLERLSPEDLSILPKWVGRGLGIKKGYIEEDEFDRGRRNLLNYGHTFGHAFEASTHFEIPHGIAVTLGMLAATFASARLGMVPEDHYLELRGTLRPWCAPLGQVLASVPPASVLEAMRHDKKNAGQGVTCILTRGFGAMEKRPLRVEDELGPILSSFLATELVHL